MNVVTSDESHRLDALLPPEMARQATVIGVKKAGMDAVTTFTLAVLAGAFIALGAVIATVAATGAENMLPFGLARVLTGTVFSVGLILVIVGGAELFTGNNLIIMAWASGQISTLSVLRNWCIVFLGNLVGATATAALVVFSGHHKLGDGAIGSTALNIAKAKMGHSFLEAVMLGILCNVLVCLAVWLTYSARTTTDRILAIMPPIATFVAAGFEHSVANMYFIPVALLMKSFGGSSLWKSVSSSPDQYEVLSWSGFLTHNLLPVTIGNVIGGAGLVGAVYWFVYLRRER